MLRMTLAASPFLVGLVAFAAPGDPFPAPITPAGEGKLQCHEPDTVRKTCRSLAGYRQAENGAFENVASVGVTATPATVMELVSPVTIRDGQVCGFIRPADVDTASFTIDDAPADPTTTATLRQHLHALYASMFNREVCTGYVPEGDGLVTRPSIDGVAVPQMSQHVIWVSPSDGYRVGN